MENKWCQAQQTLSWADSLSDLHIDCLTNMPLSKHWITKIAQRYKILKNLEIQYLSYYDGVSHVKFKKHKI